MTDTPTRGRPALIEAAGFSYFPLTLVARLPFAMMVVGVITGVTATQGLTLGGITAAVVGFSGAAAGPLLGALVDRFGQRRTILVSGIANSLLLLGLAVAIASHAGALVILGCGVLVGATAPQVGPMSRTRLTELVRHRIGAERRDRVVDTVMAYESAVDESVFIVGPIVVGVLALIDPVLPLFGAAGLALVFVTGFALHPSGVAVRRHAAAAPVRQAPARELVAARVLSVAAGTLGVGLLFGATLTSLTGFMAAQGRPEQAALVYGCMGVGSATAALAVAWLPRRFAVRMRWVAFAALIVVTTALLPALAGTALLIPLMIAVGIGIGPTLVSLFSLGTARSPLGRTATTMTILGSAVTVGQATAAAIVGVVEPSLGASAALVAPGIAAALILVAALVDLGVVRPARRGTADATSADLPQA